MSRRSLPKLIEARLNEQFAAYAAKLAELTKEGMEFEPHTYLLGYEDSSSYQG